MEESFSRRPLTPGEAREARKQQAMREHQEKIKLLNKERQSILTNEVLWTGRAESMQQRQQGNAAAEERARQRMALVQQLQQERAASETMLEALRANKPFREAQRLARSVASDLMDLNRDESLQRDRGGTLSSIYEENISSHSSPSLSVMNSKPSSHAFAPSFHAKASSTSLVYHEPQPSISRGPSQHYEVEQHQIQRQGPSRGKKYKSSDLRASDMSYLDYGDQGGGLEGAYGVPAAARSQMSMASGMGPGGGGRRTEEAVSAPMAPMMEAMKMQMETFASMMSQQQQQQMMSQQQQQQMLQQQQQQIFQQQQQMMQQMVAPQNNNNQNASQSRGQILKQEQQADFCPPPNRSRGDKRPDVGLQPRGSPPTIDNKEGFQDHFPLPEDDEEDDNHGGGDVDQPPARSQMEIDRRRANEAPQIEPRVDKRSEANAGGGNVTIESDDISCFVNSAGPLGKKGTYRLRVVLYDGFQPLTAGPGLLIGASTSRRKAVGEDGSLSVTWNDSAVLKGIKVSPTMMLVFEVYLAKLNVADLPSNEALVAWGYTSLVSPQGEVPKGSQSVPLFRLPLMISAQRKFSFGGAMLDFSITCSQGLQGEPGSRVEDPASAPGGSRGGAKSASQDERKKKAGPEDVPGVPVEAWCRVARGVPPSDPFTPGEGFVLAVDGARFLPASITISKVTARVFASDRKQLVQQTFEAVASPDSDTHSPNYLLQASIGQGRDSQFDNATATLLFAVYTICRYEGVHKVVGYAALPLFLDPGTQAQPASRNTREYILNQGAFQIPLHIAPPPPYSPFRGDALQSVSRVPCASLLVRILTPESAKAQRKKPLPSYTDKVYDTTRSIPSPIDRKLFSKYMTRRPLTVREAARMVVANKKVDLGRKSQGVKQPVPPSEPPPSKASSSDADKKGGKGGGFFSRFKSAANVVAEVASFSASSGKMSVGDLGDIEEFSANALPSSDAELMDWMEDRLRKDTQSPLNYNLASEYFADNGFYVAADGAMRLDRNLPAASLITFAPPGSFYLDNPVVDDMKATLDYDLNQPLANPRWLDGYQHFDGVAYEQGLCVIFDVRLLIPSTGASAPAGWTALPVFERQGQFVATGSYHLPLFQGVPSRFLVQEFGNKGDVEGVIAAQLASGRIRVSEECPSILVRIMDASRVGQCDVPSGGGPTGVNDRDMRLPSYLENLGGAKYLSMMRKVKVNKTYQEAKPKNITEDKFVEQMNECIIKVAGLDTKGLKGERRGGQEEEEDDDDSEFWSDEDEESEPEEADPRGNPRGQQQQQKRGNVGGVIRPAAAAVQRGGQGRKPPPPAPTARR